MSLEFLSPAPGAVARSPMEREAVAAGARIERRDGWNVAVAFDGPEPERERCRSSVGFADRSALGKLELQAGPDDLAAIVGARLELGKAIRSHSAEPSAHGVATRANGAWWCPYTAQRALVLCEPEEAPAMRERLEDGPAGVVDVTAAHGALAIVGPLARELFARFTAIDLRPPVAPLHAWRPGSVARVPGAILREGEDRWLMLFGAALGRYMWTVVQDAALSLGGGPVGTEALDPVDAPLEAMPRA